MDVKIFFDHLKTFIISEQKRKQVRFRISAQFLNPVLRKIGYTIVADHFYQPIPSDRDILLYRERERPLQSIDWQIDNQMTFVENVLQKYRHEFNNDDILYSCGYTEETAGIASGDVEFLYAMVRARKPTTVIEIGSGSSTQIIASALKQNFREQAQKTTFVAVEPYPHPYLRNLAQNDFMNFHLITKPVQTIDISMFAKLRENDFLFVDSSHVFKQGSDVEFEFLQIYPILKKGVLVHIHDIFFPFDYPTEWLLKKYWFWNEQYFLETFLQFNTKYEILASLSMIAYYNHSILTNAISKYHLERNPGSFWMLSRRD